VWVEPSAITGGRLGGVARVATQALLQLTDADRLVGELLPELLVLLLQDLELADDVSHTLLPVRC
jgi:hypothetical protein